jgi:hypothetical protein
MHSDDRGTPQEDAYDFLLVFDATLDESPSYVDEILVHD